jgi:hypothetical protein
LTWFAGSVCNTISKRPRATSDSSTRSWGQP